MNPSENETLQDENVRLALNYAVDKKELLAKAFLGRGEIIDGYLFPEIDGQNKAIVGYDFDKEKAEEILDKAGFVVNGSGLREKPTEETTPSEIKSELKLGSQGAEVRKLQECLSDPSVGGEEVYPERKITGFFDEATKQAVIAFQEKYSDQILKPSGLAHGTGTVGKATRAKINELCEKLPAKTSLLSFTITTVNQPLLIDIANIIKEQWQKIGVEAKIEALEIETIERDVVKPRNYEMLVFGEALGLIPDPFPFWHSSQKKDPGLNLSLYENKQADKLLEEARLAIKESERNEKLKEFQELLLAEVPAIFLCRPDYSYWTSPAIKGIGGKIISDPSKRFININQWHIYNDRKLK